MAKLKYIQFGDYEVPSKNLSDYTVNWANIHSAKSDRADDGIMNLDIVRPNVYTLKIELKMLTNEQLAKIKEITTPKYFEVTFYHGEIIKGTFYRGDVSSNLKFADGEQLFWDVTFNVIER